MRGVAVALMGLVLMAALVVATTVESEALCTESTWCH